MSAMYVCPNCGERFGNAGCCPGDGARLEDNSADPLLGAELGSYRVARRIGTGGMGQVYLGVQPAIGSRVAIKLLSAELAGDVAQVERFFTEARAVNVIRHEGIVNVLDLSRTNEGRPYIVMEYLDGSPLSALIAERGALPVIPTLHLVLEVLSALDAAHGVGIVHRDIKPENIFVSPAGRIKLLDFGIAKLRPGLAERSLGTCTGALMGTPYYMSPEQASGKEAEPRSDLYSLGIVLYQMLTGRLPFSAPTLYELLKQQIEVLPVAPRFVRPELPVSVESVLLAALQKDPSLRYVSAAAMSAALLQVMTTLPPDGEPLLCGRVSGNTPRLPARVPSPVGRWVPSPNIATPNGGASVLLGTPGTPPAAVNTLSPSLRPRRFAVFAVVASTFVFFAILGGLGWVAWHGWRTWTGGRVQWSRAVTLKPTSVASALAVASRQKTPAALDTMTLQDPHRVQVWEHFERARGIALRTFSDARLVRIDVIGMKPDGTVDLSVSGNFSSTVLFRWRSPSASKPPEALPGGAKYRARCLYYYVVSEHGVLSYAADHLDCNEPFVEMPRCRPTAVWAKAVAAGAPKGNYIGDLSYFATEDRPGTWVVNIGTFSGFVKDDC